MKLRCYCCGDPVDVNTIFAIVAYVGDADRVFIMKRGHENRVMDQTNTRTILVKRVRE